MAPLIPPDGSPLAALSDPWRCDLTLPVRSRRTALPQASKLLAFLRAPGPFTHAAACWFGPAHAGPAASPAASVLCKNPKFWAAGLQGPNSAPCCKRCGQGCSHWGCRVLNHVSKLASCSAPDGTSVIALIGSAQHRPRRARARLLAPLRHRLCSAASWRWRPAPIAQPCPRDRF